MKEVRETMRWTLWLVPALAAFAAFAAESPETDPAPVVEEDYVIGPEDVLQVVVWGEPDLSLSLKVRPDGKITVPLINDIRVVGLTPMEVRDVIAERLREFIRDPNVTVIVDQINSFRVFFIGEVASQGAISFTRAPTLLQAIAEAGGLTEFAKKEIVLLRRQDGVEKRFVVNYKQLLAGDPRQENLELRPGDTLIVP
jgi:polysaccharide export outer membrane protein